MTAAEFPQFYEAVHGYPPFPWQTRLADRVAHDQWPDSIGIPTACGKTSVIDVAIFGLALQAALPPARRTAPMRTFFVIDRRIVVDEAAGHAIRLSRALRESVAGAAAPPIVAEVANRLLSFGARVPLQVDVLRGGMYRDESWVRDPNQPIICLTTVDQVGSRLLFRGYHVSQSQRPIQAALVGTDSLLVLDEAHVSQPLLDTLGQVRTYQAWAERPIIKPLKYVTMSATGRQSNDRFGLLQEDFDNPALKRRLEASKIAELREPGDFEADAAAQAQRLALLPGVKAVGVVVNHVSSARYIFERLRAKHGERAVLLTGRIRPYDRDRLLDRALPNVRAGRDRSLSAPAFMVATQTIEVGANIDFDAMATEAAPIDALLQRFGRLDRFGEIGSSRAVILLRKHGRKEGDLVYGDALPATWAWLKEHAKRRGKLLEIDFCVQRMTDLLEQNGNELLYARAPSGPLLFPAHVETWAQTSPTPNPDPDVAPFLHGPAALDGADVQVVWRADLDLGSREDWIEVASLAPPVQRESMSIPLHAVRAWLRRQGREVTDVEGSWASESEEVQLDAEAKSFVIWQGPEYSRVETNPFRVKAGDTILVPADYGGADEFGWHPLSLATVRDIGDECANQLAEQKSRRFRLRLHSHVLFHHSNIPDARIAILLEQVRILENEGEPVSEKIDAILGYLGEVKPEVRAVIDALQSLGAVIDRYPSGTGCVLTARTPTAMRAASLTLPETGDDTTDADDTSSMLSRKITLADHSSGVVAAVKRFASKCGLPEETVGDLADAALLHDLGKCDPRFQAMLHGGNAAAAAAEPAPLAKSGSPFSAVAEYRRARLRSGYPEGARHEFTSVALARASEHIYHANDPELVLHLIGTHHGRGRPFPPLTLDRNPVDFECALGAEKLATYSDHGIGRLESGWTEQFWRLMERYGFWGLAYLETILRLADWTRSREEQEQ